MMPRRTNEKQQVIELLRVALAGPNCTVTPSKMMVDSAAGYEREVDVVAEHSLDGDTFVQSFEVTARRNRVDVERVEQLLRKHENLATDRLFIVSWYGFTQGARALAQTDPRLVLVTPEVVMDADGPAQLRLYLDVVSLTPKKRVLVVERPSGEVLRVLIEPDYIVYDANGAEITTAQEVFDAMLNKPEAIEQVMRTVHDHPERDNLRAFVLGADTSASGFSLRNHELQEDHRILAVEVGGEISFSQEPLDLEVRSFGDRPFAHGRAHVGDASGLVVAALDTNLDVTRLETNIDPREYIRRTHRPGPQ